MAAAAGGSVPSKITTLQLWDGSNWTTNPTGLAGQRSSGGTNASPTQGNLLVTGGTGPGPTNYNPTATEELSFPEPKMIGFLFLNIFLRTFTITETYAPFVSCRGPYTFIYLSEI